MSKVSRKPTSLFLSTCTADTDAQQGTFLFSLAPAGLLVPAIDHSQFDHFKIKYIFVAELFILFG